VSETVPEPAARTTGKPGSAKAGLQKRIGPLPLWAWGGLAIGGALAFYFASGQRKKAKQTAQPAQSAQATSPYQGMSSIPTNPAPGTSAPTSSTPTTSTPTTGGDTDDTGPGSDKGKGKHPASPGGPGRTGGWKGQHSNGQGSHHGKATTPAKTKTKA
jgi:hypothetical protein